MKILVSGATGRVGRNLTRTLLQRGDSVRAIVLPDDPGRLMLEQMGAACVTGDLKDYNHVREAVVGVDAIFHLGAVMLWGSDDYNSVIFEDNVKGTFHLLQAAATSGQKFQRIFLASSDEVYPSLFAKYLPIDEEHPQQPYSFYGLSKELNERTGFFFHRSYGLPVTIARFSLVAEAEEILRPTGWSGRLIFLSGLINLFKATNRAPAVAALEALVMPGREQLLIARDEAGFPYEFQMCDVRDLIHGLLLLLEEPAAIGEIFNLSGPSSFTYDKAIPYLSEKSGIPYAEARVAGPPIRVRHSISKARSLLGYRPEYDIYRIIDSAMAGKV